jgi:hypothetical protein
MHDLGNRLVFAQDGESFLDMPVRSEGYILPIESPVLPFPSTVCEAGADILGLEMYQAQTARIHRDAPRFKPRLISRSAEVGEPDASSVIARGYLAFR